MASVAQDADVADKASDVEAPKDDWTFAELLRLLPALPRPDLRSQRGESFVGCSCVSVVVVGCVAGAHTGVQLMSPALGHIFPLWAPPLLLSLVYCEAVTALVCLAGLMFGDPGIIQRTPRTCLPVPPEVAGKLRAGERVDDMKGNIVGIESSYCVRCFVWRVQADHRALTKLSERACHFKGCPSGMGFHHCSVCQRCVVHFDHHCGFFGRCIAGRGFGGNLGYFKVIITMGHLGVLTAGVALLMGISQVNYGRWIVIGVMIYGGCICCCMTIMCCSWWCQSILMKVVSRWLKYQDSRRRGAMPVLTEEGSGVVLGAPSAS